MALSLCLKEVPSDPQLGGPSIARALLAPPTPSRRGHRGLACRSAVRGALDVPPVAARPHPGAALRRSRWHLEDAPDNNAVLQHVVVVLAPTRGVAALEDQRRHGTSDAATRLSQR